MEPADRSGVRGYLGGFGVSFRYLAIGAAVGLGGLLLFWLTAGSLLLSLVGIGLPLLVLLVPVLRRFARAQRKRVERLLGTPVGEKYAAATSPLGVLKDRAVWKDLAFLAANTIVGTPLCFIGLSLLSGALCWGTAPIWWTFLPPAAHLTFRPVTSWAEAFGATGIGLGYAAGL
ncbi:sensor domain-containing protein, partial [Amycolatopsis sp. NPDC000746]